MRALQNRPPPRDNTSPTATSQRLPSHFSTFPVIPPADRPVIPGRDHLRHTNRRTAMFATWMPLFAQRGGRVPVGPAGIGAGSGGGGGGPDGPEVLLILLAVVVGGTIVI